MRKILPVLLFIFMGVVLHADTLVYKYKAKGVELYRETATAPYENRSISEAGFVLVNYDPANDLYGDATLYVCRDRKEKTYTVEPFFSLQAKTERIQSDKGLVMTVTDAKGTVTGPVGRGLQAGDNIYIASGRLKGRSSWNAKYSDEAESIGSSEVSLTFDAKRTEKVSRGEKKNALARNEIAEILGFAGYSYIERPSILTETSTELKNVVIDGATIDNANIGLGSSESKCNAFFNMLAVGKLTDSYVMPVTKGEAGQVLVTGGDGGTYWGKVSDANLDSTLVKSTDTRLSDPRKWNGFFSTDADKTNALYSLGIAGFKSFPGFGMSATNACVGNDFRLTDSRKWNGEFEDDSTRKKAVKNLSLTYDDISGSSKSTVTYGNTSGTACEGNDVRLSDARAWDGAFKNTEARTAALTSLFPDGQSAQTDKVVAELESVTGENLTEVLKAVGAEPKNYYGAILRCPQSDARYMNTAACMADFLQNTEKTDAQKLVDLSKVRRNMGAGGFVTNLETNADGKIQYEILGGVFVPKSTNSNITTDVILDKTSTFTGAATMNAGLTVATGHTAVQTLTSAGAATLNSLGVTNGATVGGTLGVTGNTTLGGTLAVTGDTAVGGALGVVGNGTVGGTLGVTGNTTLTNLTTTGNTVLGDANTDTVTLTAKVAGPISFTDQTGKFNLRDSDNSNAATLEVGNLDSDAVYQLPDLAGATGQIGVVDENVYGTTTSDNRFLNSADNLNDVADKATSRTNLDVYAKAETFANDATPFSELDTMAKKDTARGNLGLPKDKIDATTAPTVNNDVDEGYTVGSRWLDVTNDISYLCIDTTDGAAKWVRFLDRAANLSDLENAGTARTNLGLGSLAVKNTVANGDIDANAVTTDKIADGTIANADLAANSVATGNIIDGTIATADLADGAVNSAKITDGTIQSVDIADGSIDSIDIGNGTIGNVDLAANCVTADKIVDNTITIGDVATAAVDPVSGFGSWVTTNNTGTARTNLGLGALATLNTVGNAQITDVAAGKVTGLGALATRDTVGTAQIDNGSVGMADINADPLAGGFAGWVTTTDQGQARLALGFNATYLEANKNLSDVTDKAAGRNNLDVYAKGDVYTKAEGDAKYEPAFGKNSGFNKNFGTAAGTVAEGNHNHDSRYGAVNPYSPTVAAWGPLASTSPVVANGRCIDLGGTRILIGEVYYNPGNNFDYVILQFNYEVMNMQITPMCTSDTDYSLSLRYWGNPNQWRIAKPAGAAGFYYLAFAR